MRPLLPNPNKWEPVHKLSNERCTEKSTIFTLIQVELLVLLEIKYFCFIVITVLMEDFLKAAMLKIPTLAGLKFTSYDMFDLGRCLVLDKERIQILYGGDEVS